MRVVRAVLALALGAALAATLALPEPDSFGVAMPATILAFLLGGGALAVDAIDPDRIGLVADATAVVVAGLVVGRLLPPEGALAVAVAAQALPVLRRRRSAPA